MDHSEDGRFIAGLADNEAADFLDGLTHAERLKLRGFWPLWARPDQLPPAGDWRLWLICAGRGFGKTRAGAEWVRHVAEEHPFSRIALVARSIHEARSVMVEGESGIMACHTDSERPHFEPSLRRLTWPGGAQATLFSALEPESLRGPQHSHACRAGAERVYCQRGFRPARCSSPRHCRRRGQRSACRPGGWRVLDCRRCADRRMGHPRRHPCLPRSGQLAVHPAVRRPRDL